MNGDVETADTLVQGILNEKKLFFMDDKFIDNEKDEYENINCCSLLCNAASSNDINTDEKTIEMKKTESTATKNENENEERKYDENINNIVQKIKEEEQANMG
eukprot:31193_1